MGHYKSNVRDLEFNLFEVLGLGSILDSGAYGDLDADTVKEMLNEVRRLAEGPLADSFADADRNPPVFDPETHTVAIPESFKKSFRALQEGGWEKLGLPEALGGLGVPRTVHWAISELILGANPAVYMYAAGPGVGPKLHNKRPQEENKWGKIAKDRRRGAPNVLTQPPPGGGV
ncbi:acyl-CoA dehydrogenase family protein, partial [Nocardia brasiliensis]|uniref:acyl-CoA dehydrogenase family protein n=1 Tax=Nocardia brasiliensis TaxID=37326 RepID=UPI00245576AE